MFSRQSPCSPSCPGTHTVDQAGHELTEMCLALPPAGIKSHEPPCPAAIILIFSENGEMYLSRVPPPWHFAAFSSSSRICIILELISQFLWNILKEFFLRAGLAVCDKVSL